MHTEHRNRRLDAARGLLIVLVVVGHFIEVSCGPAVHGISAGWMIRPQQSLLTAIYAFHMPAFAFLTGITARRSSLLARMGGIAALLLVTQVCYVAVLYAIHGHSPTGILEPYLLLWFLAAMLWWYAALPIIDRLPGAVAFAIACALSLLVGFVGIAGNTLGYQRAFVFLPFFVAGHLWGAKLLTAAEFVIKSRLAAAAAGLAAVCIVLALAQPLPARLFENGSYSALPGSTTHDLLLRAAMLAAAGLATVCLVLVVPTLPVAVLIGSRSLAVYVFHYALVLVVAPHFGAPAALDAAWAHLVLAVALAGVAVAVTVQAPCEHVARLVMSTGRRIGATVSEPARSAA